MYLMTIMLILNGVKIHLQPASCNYRSGQSKDRVKEVPLFAMLTRNISSKFFPSSCQHMSTIPEKTLHVIDLSKMDIL